MGSVDVRGGAPATKETDLLNPVNTVQVVHAFVLSGGSAFGLDASTGVMRYLEEHGIGFDVRGRARAHRAGGEPHRSLVRRRCQDSPDADCGYRAGRRRDRRPGDRGQRRRRRRIDGRQDGPALSAR